MKNIKTIVSSYQPAQLEAYCAENGIVLVKYLDAVTHAPGSTLLLMWSDELVNKDIRQRIEAGYSVGTYISEIVDVFNGLPDYGNTEEVYTGFYNISDRCGFKWGYIDTYKQDEAAWLAKRVGEKCPSCGGEKYQRRDFSHGCGDVCYMCS
jgi:hypothetical protein